MMRAQASWIPKAIEFLTIRKSACISMFASHVSRCMIGLKETTTQTRFLPASAHRRTSTKNCLPFRSPLEAACTISHCARPPALPQSAKGRMSSQTDIKDLDQVPTADDRGVLSDLAARCSLPNLRYCPNPCSCPFDRRLRRRSFQLHSAAPAAAAERAAA